MKTRLVLTALLSAIGLSTALSQSYIVEDDIYYSRKKKENPIVQERREQMAQPSVSTASAPLYSEERAPAQPSGRNVDEYNRQAGPSLGDMTMDQLDSLAIALEEREEEGYYLNEFVGSEQDEEYAERIRRFHNPRYTVFVGDPAYNDIYFLNSLDWNVYVDGNYAYVTPTWSNRWYTDFMFSPFSYSSLYWRWGGMHSSWAWGLGFSGHGFYDPWGYGGYYGGYYGHHHHNHWGGYYGWGGHYPHYPVTLPSYASSRSTNYSHGRSSGNASNYTSRGSSISGRSSGNVGRSSNSGTRGSGTYQSAGRSRYTNVTSGTNPSTRPSSRPSTGSSSVQSGRTRYGSSAATSGSSGGTYRSSGRSSSSSGVVNGSSSSSYGRSSSSSSSSSSSYSTPSNSSSSRSSSSWSTPSSSGGRSSSAGSSSSGGSSSGGGGRTRR